MNGAFGSANFSLRCWADRGALPVPAMSDPLKRLCSNCWRGFGDGRGCWRLDTKRKSSSRAVFTYLAAQVLAREIYRTLWLLGSIRELKLALRARCWARVWALPCTSDLRVRSGRVVSLTCFSRPARFSGRISRSVGDSSPRGRGVSPARRAMNRPATLSPPHEGAFS